MILLLAEPPRWPSESRFIPRRPRCRRPTIEPVEAQGASTKPATRRRRALGERLSK